MGGIKLKIHPLFYLFGLYYALTGRIFVFIIYTVCAFSHEMGHSVVAEKVGYKLNKITLMPFGAVVNGYVAGLKPSDRLKIALAGPMLNLFVALLFVALWWIFPIIYAYTDIVVEANISMCVVNLIPVYPLDGGRILYSFLSERFSEKTAAKVCKATGIVLSILLFTLFVFSAFHTVNFSLLFFTLFVLFGAFNTDKENRYVKIRSLLTKDRLVYGFPIKRFGIDKNATVKSLVNLIDVNSLNELVVFKDGKPIAKISQDRINDLIEKANIYDKISKYV